METCFQIWYSSINPKHFASWLLTKVPVMLNVWKLCPYIKPQGNKLSGRTSSISFLFENQLSLQPSELQQWRLVLLYNGISHFIQFNFHKNYLFISAVVHELPKLKNKKHLPYDVCHNKQQSCNLLGKTYLEEEKLNCSGMTTEFAMGRIESLWNITYRSRQSESWKRCSVTRLYVLVQQHKRCSNIWGFAGKGRVMSQQKSW